MICNLRAQLVALVEKTFSLAGLARLDRSAKKALQPVKNVMRVASARKAPLSCTNVLLVLSAMLDRANVHSAPPDRTASRGAPSPQFVRLVHLVRKVHQIVTYVMLEASALETHQLFRNVLLEHTAMLDRVSVHSALPDRTASRGPLSPSFVNLDRTVQKARKNVKNVMREASVLEAHPSLRNVLLALTAVQKEASVHYALLDHSAKRGLQALLFVRLVRTAVKALKLVRNVMEEASAPLVHL